MKNQAAFLEMHQVIKYVLNGRSHGLKLEPNMHEKELWDIVHLGDSDYVGDPVTRRMVGSFVLNVLDVLVSANKGTDKHDSLKFRLHMNSTFGGCKIYIVSGPIAVKYKNFT